MKFDFIRWRSLKARVAFFSLAIFLISIWSLAFYADSTLHKDLEQLLGEQQFSTTSIMAADINREVDFRLRSLEKTAARINSIMLSNGASLQALLEDSPLLESLFNGGCFVTRSDGTAIASIPLSAHRRGINYLDRDHVAAALKKGKSTVSSPAIGKVLHIPVVSMATPIIAADGAVIGVLVGVIDLSRPNFLDAITENCYGKSGGFLLVAPQHRMIITSSDKSRIIEQLPAPGVNPLIDRFIQGYEGTQIFTNPKGVEVLASAKGVPAAGWYVTTILPTEELFAPVHAMLHRILVVATILTILAGGVIWWMLRRQLSPILDAVSTLDALSDSELSVAPLPVPRQDEVGQLMGAFNRLLETLALRETTLIEREERHRSILQTAINGIWQADCRGRLIEVNEAYCRMSGYSEQELLTMNIADLDALESPADVINRLELIKERGGARFESRHRRRDGALFDVEVSAQYRAVESGQYVAFVQEITERKQMEQNLRRSRDEWSRTFDSMLDLIFIIDDHHRILNINQTALDALGITREQALASPCYAYMHGTDSLPECCPHSDTLHDKGEHKIDKLLEPLGRHFQVTTTPIFDDNVIYQATVHVAHDITESTNHARDLELARDAAEAANRTKSEFLANMSHEIRTPMNGIMGMSQLLEYTPLTDTQRRYLEAIRVSADNLLTIINDILDLSRIESGKLELEQRVFSLRGCIGDVIKTQSSQIHHKGLSMQVDIPEVVPDSLTGDELRLKQILINLLGNAIKFTARGGISIAVSVSEQDDQTALLKIGVTDSGIGIGSAALRKIFEPFVQADGSTTRQYGGTGLGLAICTRLTRLMGGTIRAESTEGSGSTFLLQIPFTVNDAAMDHQKVRSSAPPHQLWDGVPLRILLVDDQEINLALAQEILQGARHHVITARDGCEALEKWETDDAIELILMDIQMQVMSGIEATRTIREREMTSGRHLPIIAVTARAMFKEREIIMSQGFDGYVTKPFGFIELLGEIKSCLRL